MGKKNKHQKKRKNKNIEQKRNEIKGVNGNGIFLKRSCLKGLTSETGSKHSRILDLEI